MKNTARVFYIIGLVLNIIAIIGCIIMAVVYGNMTTQQYIELVQDGSITVEDAQTTLSVLKGAFIAVTVVELIVLLITIWALKSLSNNVQNYASHIIMLIIGILGIDLFYILGGIFGIIAEGQEPEKEALR